MIRTILLSLIIILSTYSTYAQNSYLTDTNGDGTLRVVVVGDSIARGTGDFTGSSEEVISAFQPSAGQEAGYPLRLEGLLDVEVSNFGVPGELLTSTGLARFARIVNQSRPDLAIVTWGSNDGIFQIPPTRYARAMQTIANIAEVNGINLIITAIPPSCCDHQGLDFFTGQYNDYLELIANKNPLRLAKISSAFKNTCTNITTCRLLNLPEGLHPNILGYDVMGEVIAASILDIDIFSIEGQSDLENALGLIPGSIITVPNRVSSEESSSETN